MTTCTQSIIAGSDREVKLFSGEFKRGVSSVGAEPSNSWALLAGRGSRISTSLAPDPGKSNVAGGDSLVFGTKFRARVGWTISREGVRSRPGRDADPPTLEFASNRSRRARRAG